MSPAVTPERALSRTWKRLGAPTGAPSALVMGPQGLELARAVRDELSPATLVLMHAEAPPARSRFTTTPVDLSDLAQQRPRGFDLVAAAGLHAGDLASARQRLAHIAGVLKPGGLLAAVVETLAAPDPDSGGYDHLLFPHLVRSGDLGEDLRTRTLLPAAAWCALIRTVGFDIVAVEGVGGQSLPPDFAAMHRARLASYDHEELSCGSLQLIARRTEDDS